MNSRFLEICKRDGAEANQILRAKVSTLSKATIEDSTLANKDLGLSIDGNSYLSIKENG